MATYYVYSGAGGAGTGADWANAFTTLTAAVSGKAAGDVFYVAHDHAESTAGAVTITFPGSIGNPGLCYCADRAGSVPPVSADLRTTATVTTTGNNALTVNGLAFYVYGIIFSAGSGANSVTLTFGNSNVSWARAESCAFQLGGTSGGFLSFSAGNAAVFLKNCTIQVAAAGSSLHNNAGTFFWDGPSSSITGGTLPTNLASLGIGGRLGVFRAVDLSALGSGKTLVAAGNSGAIWVLQDCKLGASVTVSGTPTSAAGFVDVIRCDSGGTNYRTERYRATGTQTTETTIVRTGGATDGTTPHAWKIVTTANSKWVNPFESQTIRIWNDVTASNVTVTVYGIWGGGAVPNNDEIWIEVEYLGASGNPQGSFKTTTKADNLATGSAVTSDGSTWGGSTTAFKMVATLTSPQPAQKGYINITVKAATASTTFYVDPKPELS